MEKIKIILMILIMAFLITVITHFEDIALIINDYLSRELEIALNTLMGVS